MTLVSGNTACTLLDITPRQLYEFVLNGVPVYDRDGDSLLFFEEPQARRIEMLSLAMEASTLKFEENIKGCAVITTTYKVLDKFEFSASRSIHDLRTLISLRATKEARDFFSFPLHDKKLIEFCRNCHFHTFELKEVKDKYIRGIIEKIYPDINWDSEPFYTPEPQPTTLLDMLPDNPSDYGKMLMDKGYPTNEILERLSKEFPHLKNYELGAYGRGLYARHQ